MALIDPVVVRGLVEARLRVVDGLAVLFETEPDPEPAFGGEPPARHWCRLLACDVRGRNRVKIDQPDAADAAIVVQVVSIPESVDPALPGGSAYQHQQMAHRVAAALDEAALADDQTTHHVQIGRAETRRESGVDGGRGLLVSTVTAAAWCQRVSGADAASVP